jgi:hypothetical protein
MLDRAYEIAIGIKPLSFGDSARRWAAEFHLLDVSMATL